MLKRDADIVHANRRQRQAFGIRFAAADSWQVVRTVLLAADIDARRRDGNPSDVDVANERAWPERKVECTRAAERFVRRVHGCDLKPPELRRQRQKVVRERLGSEGDAERITKGLDDLAKDE